MTEPMTAAEYRHEVGVPRTILGARLLAALEEREALLGRVAELEDDIRGRHKDAAVGALVRRIREHPMANFDPMMTMRLQGETWNAYVNKAGLTATLSHLDSLLPKEPEEVVGPSGWRYEPMTGGNGKPWVGIRDDFGDKVAEVPSENDIYVPPIDRETARKVLEASRAK